MALKEENQALKQHVENLRQQTIHLLEENKNIHMENKSKEQYILSLERERDEMLSKNETQLQQVRSHYEKVIGEMIEEAAVFDEKRIEELNTFEKNMDSVQSHSSLLHKKLLHQ